MQIEKVFSDSNIYFLGTIQILILGMFSINALNFDNSTNFADIFVTLIMMALNLAILVFLIKIKIINKKLRGCDV